MSSWDTIVKGSILLAAGRFPWSLFVGAVLLADREGFRGLLSWEQLCWRAGKAPWSPFLGAVLLRGGQGSWSLFVGAVLLKDRKGGSLVSFRESSSAGGQERLLGLLSWEAKGWRVLRTSIFDDSRSATSFIFSDFRAHATPTSDFPHAITFLNQEISSQN